MYIKRKGTETPIEVRVAPGPQRDPDFGYNSEYINPDSLFVFHEPGKGVTMLNFDSDKVHDFDVCTADGRTVCSLSAMGNSMVHSCANLAYTNARLPEQIEALAEYAERHENGSIMVKSAVFENRGIGVNNPTLDQLGDYATRYHMFDFSPTDYTPSFDEKFPELFSTIEKTAHAVNNAQEIEGYMGTITIIEGSGLLTPNLIFENHNVEPENLIIADKKTGCVDIYTTEAMANQLDERFPSEGVYLCDNGTAICTLYFDDFEQQMQEIKESMEQGVQQQTQEDHTIPGE
jgi:hypothetical protein